MKKIIKILCMPIFIIALSSCANKNENHLYNKVTDPTAREIINKPIDKITIKGLGTVKKGDILTHKTMGKGVAENLFKRNGYAWVAFMIDGIGSLILLSSDYFESIE